MLKKRKVIKADKSGHIKLLKNKNKPLKTQIWKPKREKKGRKPPKQAERIKKHIKRHNQVLSN